MMILWIKLVFKILKFRPNQNIPEKLWFWKSESDWPQIRPSIQFEGLHSISMIWQISYEGCENPIEEKS